MSNVTVTEYFVDGRFSKGHVEGVGYSNDYTDESRISLLPGLPSMPLDYAEEMAPTTKWCNGKHYGKAYVKLFNKLYFFKSADLKGR